MSGICERMEKFGKGLSSASRFRILQELFKGPRTVGDLARATGQSQPCVSQHLKTLKMADLVTDERQGKEVRYTVNAEHFLSVLESLSTGVAGKRAAAKRPAPHR